MGIDGFLKIGTNDGLSQAIQKELGLTNEQCKKMGLSVWNKIFDIAEDSESMKDGKQWNRNDKLKVNEEISFTAKAWNKIQQLINETLDLNFADIAEADEQVVPDEGTVNNEGEVTDPENTVDNNDEVTVDETDNTEVTENPEGENPDNNTAKTIVVQMGETPEELAQKLGCTVEDLIEANPDANFKTGKDGKQHIADGAVLNVPENVSEEKYNEVNTDRQTHEEIEQIKQERRAQRAEQAKRAQEQKAQAQQAQIAKEEKEQTKKQEHMATVGRFWAQKLYNDVKGIGTGSNFEKHIKNDITEYNVAYVVNAYTEFSPDESLAEAILDEIGFKTVNDRKKLVQDIFHKLKLKAQKCGVPTNVINNAVNEFNKAYKIDKKYNNDSFDKCIQTLASAIIAQETMTNTEKAGIKSMTSSQKQQVTLAKLDQLVSESEQALKDGWATNGWAGKTVDFISGLWGSENRKFKVEEDIESYKKQVEELKSCKTEAEFKAKFKEIFDIDYNPDVVLAYQNRQEKLQLASSIYSQEQCFNNATEYYRTHTFADEKVWINQTDGPGYYQVIRTKEKVYQDAYNTMVNILARDDKPESINKAKKQINEAYKNAGLGNNATMEQKYNVLSSLMCSTSKLYHNDVMLATENKGYTTFKKECDAMYNAAFGYNNNIARRVEEYNISQQAGAMALKTTIKIVGTTVACIIPGGVALAPAVTFGLGTAVEVSDRLTSEVGLQKGEILQILKDEGINAATVLGGMGIGQALAKASTFIKIGGQMVGDIATGTVAEYAQTGNITIEGVVFQCMFSAAGNLVALKRIGNAKSKAPVQQHTPKAPESPTPVLDKAASSNQTPAGVAHPADVHVGKKKGAQIQEEVKNVANDPNATPEDLAQKRNEVEAIQNRDVRRQAEQQLDKAAKEMTPEQQQQYREINQKNLETEINDIMEKHSDVGDTDRRKISEYIETLNDETKLNELKNQIDKKYRTKGQGMTTENYNMLMKKIDDKIKALNTPHSNITEQCESVLNMLNDNNRKGKGLSGEEFKQVKEYLSNIENETQLAELQKALANRKLGSSDKRVLKQGIEAKSQALKNAKQAEVTPKAKAEAEQPKQPAEAPKEAPKVKEPVKNYSEMNENELYAEYRRLDQEMNSAGFDRKASAKNIKKMKEIQKELKAKGYSIEAGELKSKSKTSEYKLSPEQKKHVYNLREAYHEKLDDIADLRKNHPQYNNMSDKELLDFFKLDENHAAFVKNRKDLFANGEAKYMERAYWNDSPYERTNDHCAWKMHLYSVDELDYQQMAEVVLPYLNKHKIAHKTLSSTMSPELLAKTAPKQTGKAFTIYPQSQEEMAQIAKDLDKLIREHNLTTNTSHITGDNELGNSGRLFYRYEFPTGELKDRIYKPDEHAPYDANRGEGKYLANDMTLEDDIWRNFDPSDPNSMPASRTNNSNSNNSNSNTNSKKAEAYSRFDKNAPIQQTPNQSVLNQNAQYALDINNLPELKLVDGTVVDLSSPSIKQKLANLQEGQSLTIGREGDIEINAGTTISRHHILITRHNGQLVMKDISKNGNTTCISEANKGRPISNPNPQSNSVNAVQQSRNFNKTHKVGCDERIADGYKDGGRSAEISDDGSVVSNREIIVVDRTRDIALQKMIQEVKQKTANMSPKQKATFIQNYVANKCGNGSMAADNLEIWENSYRNKEVLLGDIINANPPVAVCRHRSLLSKILGDEVGLHIELQRGNFHGRDASGGHAWNVVKFEDGTSAIYDAMHNKTSSTTPGAVDDYAKKYFTTRNEDLYSNGASRYNSY